MNWRVQWLYAVCNDSMQVPVYLWLRRVIEELMSAMTRMRSVMEACVDVDRAIDQKTAPAVTYCYLKPISSGGLAIRLTGLQPRARKC